MPGKVPIEELLIDYGYLTRSQLERALQVARNSEAGVEETLLYLGYVTEAALLECSGILEHIPVIELDGYRTDEKAAAMLPAAFARMNRIIPIDLEDDRLVVASPYPFNPDVMDETATISGMEVKPVLALKLEVDRAIEKAYGRDGELEGDKGSGYAFGYITDNQGEKAFRERVESAPVVRLVNSVIEDAYVKNASDIHVEPGKNQLLIRVRINGDLILHSTLAMEVHKPMVTRLKLMSGMDIAEKRLPQDGKYHYERGAVSTDLRISTLPSIFGEKVVIRLLGNDRDNFLMDIRRLGMEEDQREVFEKILRAPHGMVLVTGPTGSGKTTTLYAMLSRIVKKKVNVVTVEDPVEKIIEGMTQVQINPKSGLTFAAALRSILRQDPDVIMVGEMRDEETVSIGVRAAITGHQVLSTLHTSDCASTISRLRNMRVPSYIAAASLSGIIAQRLIKVLCPACRMSYIPDGKEKALLTYLDVQEVERLWKPVGCPACNHTGYSGRKAVYEIMAMDDTLKNMILDNTPPYEIRSRQKKRGFKSLRDFALMRAARGETSLEEAEKIIYSVE